MTALPDPETPSEPRLLTVAEYAALGETEFGYQDSVSATGAFTVADPIELKVNLDQLV